VTPIEGRDYVFTSATVAPGIFTSFSNPFLNTAFGVLPAAHEVGTVRGDRERMIAVFSCFDRPGREILVPSSRRRPGSSFLRAPKLDPGLRVVSQEIGLIGQAWY
jgi:hypothetical protein